MKSLNKVTLIGNVTKDPELNYTEKGSAVIKLTIATNRSFKTQAGEQKEEVEFHQCVAWTKLAELISQYTYKGAKVYVEGRLETRNWEDKDGNKRFATEIILSECLFLDTRRDRQASVSSL